MIHPRFFLITFTLAAGLLATAEKAPGDAARAIVRVEQAGLHLDDPDRTRDGIAGRRRRLIGGVAHIDHNHAVAFTNGVRIRHG